MLRCVAFAASLFGATAQDGCVQKGGSQWCSARAVASAWNANSNAAADCAKAMAMAFGEGFNPALDKGSIDSINLDDTNSFNMDQTPQADDPTQDTLGPWQAKTTKTVATLSDRVGEAVGYLKQCCGTGGGCQGCSAPANCPNTVDGECTNPCAPEGGFPLTTIFASEASPPLPWCGCAETGSATIGFSGRCSNHKGDDYSQYLSAGKRVCDVDPSGDDDEPTVAPSTPEPTLAPEDPTTQVPTIAPEDPTTQEPTIAPVDPTTPEPTVAPVDPTTPEPTLAPEDPTTQEPTIAPEDPTTQEPTIAPEVPTTQEPTIAPVDPTTQEPTVVPVDPTTPEPTIVPEEPTTVAPVDPTTQEPTTVPEEPTTQEPTTIAPTTQEPTTEPESSTTSAAVTTTRPVGPTPSPKRCFACMTMCAPCQECTEGPDGSFAFGSCKKCWQCWDWDDDELEDDDDDMDEDCDATHKDHDWNDEEVRCLTDNHQDCRACWAAGLLGEMSVFV